MSPPERTITPLALAAIFFAVSTVTALNYAFLPGKPTLEARRSIQEAILNHSIQPPDRYRFVVPMLVEGPMGVLRQSM